MAERSLVRHPQGHSLGKPIMLLFLGHQHLIRRKPSDVKAWRSPFGKRDLCTHTLCQPHRFQNKLKEATLPSSHCSALGTELDRREGFILSMTNHSQSPARMLAECKGAPLGVAQAAKLLILKPFKFSDSNFHSAN